RFWTRFSKRFCAPKYRFLLSRTVCPTAAKFIAAMPAKVRESITKTSSVVQEVIGPRSSFPSFQWEMELTIRVQTFADLGEFGTVEIFTLVSVIVLYFTLVMASLSYLDLGSLRRFRRASSPLSRSIMRRL